MSSIRNYTCALTSCIHVKNTIKTRKDYRWRKGIWICLSYSDDLRQAELAVKETFWERVMEKTVKWDINPKQQTFKKANCKSTFTSLLNLS